jgi:hypothetical protein
MANPNMTMFKAMSMDEQLETIKQLAQEALRSREEIKVAEETEVPPVQDRGFPMNQDAQARGFLMIEHSK